MKAGRNDPCPCGSGKKFKKCCLTKGPSAVSGALEIATEASLPPASSRRPPAPSAVVTRKSPPEPPDPARERWETRWKEFESQEGAGRSAVFLWTLDDKELMTDDTAFEMLSLLHQDAVSAGEHARFAELVRALADRQPEVYQQSAHSYLSWCLQDALAASPQDILPLTRELAVLAGQDIDIVNRALRALAYHGQLAALVEAMRIAWPFVQSSSNIVPWGISEFREKGANYEVYNYLEHTPNPDPRDSELLDRIKFYIEDPDLDIMAESIGDLAGQASPAWTLNDFTLKPVRKKLRDDWDDEGNESEEAPDPGARNLYRLIAQFVGYLRREEGVPYPKGELIRNELYRYFIRRHAGELAPRLSMLEQAMHPKKKLPPPPKPGHPLCPERVTFEIHLAELIGFMNGLYHTAAALFEIVPAWLRFLESRGLIDADRQAKTVEELRPLHADLLRLMESYRDDPTLLRDLLTWPARPVETNPLDPR
jgi:hypothetical protein